MSDSKMRRKRRSRSEHHHSPPASGAVRVGTAPLVCWNPETGEYVDAIDDLVVREIERPVGLADSLSDAGA